MWKITMGAIEENGKQILNDHLAPNTYTQLDIHPFPPALVANYRLMSDLVQSWTLCYPNGRAKQDSIQLTEAKIMGDFRR